MNKVLLLSGVFLFVLGAALVLGSYFVFNQYSLSGTRKLAYDQYWMFPSSPLQLSQGDKVTVRMQVIINTSQPIGPSSQLTSSYNLEIENTEEQAVFSYDGLSQNITAYYYVQANNFYYFYISGYYYWAINVTYHIKVVSNAPNLLSLLLGTITLLAGAAAIPTAFLYRTKTKETTSSSHEQPKPAKNSHCISQPYGFSLKSSSVQH